MLYARFEIPYLKLNYLILKGPLQNRVGRLLFYPILLVSAGLMLRLGQHGKVMTVNEINEYIDSLPDDVVIAVGSCRCRLATKACDCPIKTDITIKTGALVYKKFFPEDYEVISKNKAKKLIAELNRKGLVPMVYAFCTAGGAFVSFVICNCCPHSCIPMLAQLNTRFHVYDPGDYVAYVDETKCIGCGQCVNVCPFNARIISNGKAKVDYLKCYGCGVCVHHCKGAATVMVRRPQELKKAQISRLITFWHFLEFEIS